MAPDRWEVVVNFVETCSYCGVPCSGTIRVGYSDGDRWVAFETDRFSLSEPLGQLVDAAIARGGYAAMPAFVREWNESRGWADFDSDGAAVSADDLLRTVDALNEQRSAADVAKGEMLAGLREFVAAAAVQGRAVWAAET